MDPTARGPRTWPPGTGLVQVWDAAALEAPRGVRAAAPRPVSTSVVRPGDRAVLGRRDSEDEPARRYDADGVLRLALDQSRRLTSRQHIALTPGPPWCLDVMPEAAPSARIRSWGRLGWEPADPGSRHPLSPERPLAVLLAGEPTYLVTVHSIGTGTPAGPHPTPTTMPATDDEHGPDRPAEQVRTTRRTEREVQPAPVTLSEPAVFDLVRIFRPALQWPPHPHDDPVPVWTGMTQAGPLRASYRRIRDAAIEPLHLPSNRGPDPTLVERLVDTRCLTFTRVAAIADNADLPFAPRHPGPR